MRRQSFSISTMQFTKSVSLMDSHRVISVRSRFACFSWTLCDCRWKLLVVKKLKCLRSIWASSMDISNSRWRKSTRQREMCWRKSTLNSWNHLWCWDWFMIGARDCWLKPLGRALKNWRTWHTSFWRFFSRWDRKSTHGEFEFQQSICDALTLYLILESTHSQLSQNSSVQTRRWWLQQLCLMLDECINFLTVNTTFCSTNWFKLLKLSITTCSIAYRWPSIVSSFEFKLILLKSINIQINLNFEEFLARVWCSNDYSHSFAPLQTSAYKSWFIISNFIIPNVNKEPKTSLIYSQTPNLSTESNWQLHFDWIQKFENYCLHSVKTSRMSASDPKKELSTQLPFIKAMLKEHEGSDIAAKLKEIYDNIISRGETWVNLNFMQKQNNNQA